jgi:phage-related protein
LRSHLIHAIAFPIVQLNKQSLENKTVATIDATYRVKVPVTKRITYRRRTVRFGDGYEQRSLDGINYARESYDVTFIGLDATKKNALVAILNGDAGVTATTWTAPGDSTPKSWIFSNVSVQMSSASYFEVTATAELITG